METYIIKNQHGKFIYGRTYVNAIIKMLQNPKNDEEVESCSVDGIKIILKSKKSTEEGCEVVVEVEGV